MEKTMKLDEDNVKLIEEKIEKEFLKEQSQFETDDTQEQIDTLAEALSIDYVEKWKVYARMKVAERNFQKSEALRKSLIQKLIQTSANLDVTLKALNDKKIAVDFEINEKEKLKDEVKSLKAEIRSLKKPKDVSKRLAPEKKSPAKNA